MDDNKPANALKYPIEQLIKQLQALPPGTTFEEEEGEYHGGQCVIDGKKLGTGYKRRINIVEGVQ